MLGFRVTVKYNLPSGEERRVILGMSSYDEGEARTSAIEIVKNYRTTKGEVISDVAIALVEVL